MDPKSLQAIIAILQAIKSPIMPFFTRGVQLVEIQVMADARLINLDVKNTFNSAIHLNPEVKQPADVCQTLLPPKNPILSRDDTRTIQISYDPRKSIEVLIHFTPYTQIGAVRSIRGRVWARLTRHFPKKFTFTAEQLAALNGKGVVRL